MTSGERSLHQARPASASSVFALLLAGAQKVAGGTGVGFGRVTETDPGVIVGVRRRAGATQTHRQTEIPRDIAAVSSANVNTARCAEIRIRLGRPNTITLSSVWTRVDRTSTSVLVLNLTRILFDYLALP